MFGRGLGHTLEPLQLFQRLLLGLLGHAGLLDGFAQFGDLGLAVLALAKLFLDLAELLAQDVLSLAAGKRLLRLFADLLRQAQDLDLLGEIAQHLVETLRDIEGLEHVLLLLGREVGNIRYEVGQLRRRGDLLDRGRDLGRHVGKQRNRLAGTLLQLMHAGGDFGGIDLGLADLLDAGDEEGVAGEELAQTEAPRAARHEVMATVGRGHIAQDLGDRADAMQIVGAGLIRRRLVLQEDADWLVGPGGSLGASDRLRAPKRERGDDAGK